MRRGERASESESVFVGVLMKIMKDRITPKYLARKKIVAFETFIVVWVIRLSHYVRGTIAIVVI